MVLIAGTVAVAGRRCDQSITPAYKRTLLKWQQVPDIPTPQYRSGYRDLVLHSIYHGDTVRDFPYLPNGKIDPRVVFKYKRVFRDKKSGAVHRIHPRLIKLLYKLALTFRAVQINIVSGYREGAQPPHEGYHSEGRAVDIIIPGVKLNDIAVRARRMGHVGVGLYPNAGFVHVDVRDGPSYFWLDRSGPNKPSCHKTILSEIAPFYDGRWRLRDDHPHRLLNYRGRPLGDLTREEARAIIRQAKAATQGQPDGD
jgi:uncharacterized protein YcbK (DUF882 family)